MLHITRILEALVVFAADASSSFPVSRWHSISLLAMCFRSLRSMMSHI